MNWATNEPANKAKYSYTDADGFYELPQLESGFYNISVFMEARYNNRMQQRLAKTTWMSGCNSWYLTADGFNASMYPGFATQYLRQMRQFQFEDYHAVAHDVRPRVVTSTA